MKLAPTLLLLSVLAMIPTGAVHAQMTVATYILEDVWLVPDVTHPFYDARQMTGTFEWTYVEGDFENGTGVFTDVYIPWYWGDLASLNITIDSTSLEFTFNGNWHGHGLDVTLFLIDPLSPDQPSAIDLVRSKFQVEIGIIYQGHMVSGSIVPITSICQVDLNNDGFVDVLDFFTFVSLFATSDPAADLSGDGFVDVLDFFTFVTLFAAGCP